MCQPVVRETSVWLQNQSDAVSLRNIVTWENACRCLRCGVAPRQGSAGFGGGSRRHLRLCVNESGVSVREV